jgi:maltooligosyltrehalose trehalohydrolase
VDTVLALNKEEVDGVRPFQNAFERAQGADVTNDGVRYRIWTKYPLDVVVVDALGQPVRSIPLVDEGDGYLSGLDGLGLDGDLYLYRFPDGSLRPDPASRFQPFGVHKPSQVVNPKLYDWGDRGWTNPGARELIIYELHIGAFTREGTFAAALLKLPYLVDLGITAIELMPVADFPGERNWGYDGVSLYAPARTYGAPDDFRRLVDTAHGLGIAVILDVVYNHLGPDGNYTGAFHPDYFHQNRTTPWGSGLHFENRFVRTFFLQNPEYWRAEFHIDGFRLDATHAIGDSSPVHVLAELTETIQRCGGFAIAEDDRRDAAVLRARPAGGLGFDACWADDFHHAVHVAVTREREGYYGSYRGEATELSEIFSADWWHKPDVGLTGLLSPEQLVFFVSNHDQVGNRAFGERLGHLVSAAAYRALSALLCLGPQTPLLFMGQEWNASSPFQFFTDHNETLGARVTEGRRKEFRHFAAFSDDGRRDAIPDPQSQRTYMNSKLRWAERHAGQHAEIFRLYRECLKLRRLHLHALNRNHFHVQTNGDGGLVILFGPPPHNFAVVTDLFQSTPGPEGLRAVLEHLENPTEWRGVLSSEETRFGGLTQSPLQGPRTEVFVRNRRNRLD